MGGFMEMAGAVRPGPRSKRKCQADRPTELRREKSMTIEERIPEFTDKELENLHDNAVRLSTSGKPAQQAEAARLLPIITAALDARRVTRNAELAEKRREREAAMADARAKKKAARKAEAAARAE
jgi:hypothetical protein